MKLVPGKTNSITDVEGIRIGSVEDDNLLTGTTAVLPPLAPCCTGVFVSGGAPGTRETDALRANCLMGSCHAVFLSGGSVFGLDAGSGIAQVLSQHGQGFTAFRLNDAPPVPVVPGCVLFDVGNGPNWKETYKTFVSPYFELGRRACLQALNQPVQSNIRLGNVGAGRGARAGSYKGGLGSASAVHASEDMGLQVGALMAVNSYGSPVIPGSNILWSALWEQESEMGALRRQVDKLYLGQSSVPIGLVEDCKSTMIAKENTVIGVVATNADLTCAEAERVAIMAHDGIARSIKPSHTLVDGDCIFVLATGRHHLPISESLNIDRARAVTLIGAVAADCVTRSIGRAIWEAESIAGYTSFRDLFFGERDK
eukprot:jgi/Galph1/3021/GphlegSOOS_G1652.1